MATPLDDSTILQLLDQSFIDSDEDGDISDEETNPIEETLLRARGNNPDSIFSHLEFNDNNISRNEVLDLIIDAGIMNRSDPEAVDDDPMIGTPSDNLQPAGSTSALSITPQPAAGSSRRVSPRVNRKLTKSKKPRITKKQKRPCG